MKLPNLLEKNPSERSLYRIVSIQSEKIRRQAKEIHNMQVVQNRDARKTSVWVAFKFLIKCLVTRI